MSVTLTLAGITFNGGPDGDGDEFIVSDVEGWDGPEIELVVIERPITDGAVVAYARRAARALVLTGSVVAETVADVGRARRKLAAAMDTLVAANGTLTVAETDGTYTLGVRLAQSLRTRRGTTAQIVTFEISLLAPNPVKTLLP
jgi:hypothetical protein